jgi:hypothetical protein
MRKANIIKKALSFASRIEPPQSFLQSCLEVSQQNPLVDEDVDEDDPLTPPEAPVAAEALTSADFDEEDCELQAKHV